ncbi:MAG TPA: hypothetical protein VFI06_04735 [Chitinophagaceae bacterium]|nr:hypothetical protein [Chitinophagaceae bacterium]
MTYEQVEEIVQKKRSSGAVFQIRFKTRDSIKGLFIKTSDYSELSRKNFWRVVSETYIDEYKRTNNENLARIFNGMEFTRLEAQS